MERFLHSNLLSKLGIAYETPLSLVFNYFKHKGGLSPNNTWESYDKPSHKIIHRCEI